MEKACQLDSTYPRYLLEYDQLAARLNLPVSDRLARMEAQHDLLKERDDLYLRYITLLNNTGRYQEAYDALMSHHFHPWEGGEGKVILPSLTRKIWVKVSCQTYRTIRFITLWAWLSARQGNPPKPKNTSVWLRPVPRSQAVSCTTMINPLISSTIRDLLPEHWATMRPQGKHSTN